MIKTARNTSVQELDITYDHSSKNCNTFNFVIHQSDVGKLGLPQLVLCHITFNTSPQAFSFVVSVKKMKTYQLRPHG